MIHFSPAVFPMYAFLEPSNCDSCVTAIACGKHHLVHFKNDKRAVTKRDFPDLLGTAPFYVYMVQS